VRVADGSTGRKISIEKYFELYQSGVHETDRKRRGSAYRRKLRTKDEWDVALGYAPKKE